MRTVLALLLVQALVGAWDTLWFHEYRGRLASHLDTTRRELGLHASRDSIYVGLYGLLAWFQPAGWWVAVVAIALFAEIVITLADFVVEDIDRPAIGGIPPLERILHTVMAIVYGAMLMNLIPIMAANWSAPAALVRHDAPLWMSTAASVASVGIALTGARDWAATRGVDPIRWAVGSSEQSGVRGSYQR